MAPNRSKSAKPGGLRLPGTFNAPPSASPPPSSSSPRRSATARAPSTSTTTTATKKLPGTTPASLPASRLTNKSRTNGAENSSGGGLISSFGSGGVNSGSGRLDRAKSSPGVQSSLGQSRLERLGLNRASMRQRSPSPEEEQSGSEAEEDAHERRSQTPKPSWGRSSSDEDGPRPSQLTTSRRRRESFSPARTSSPSLRYARSPRPSSIAASSIGASSVIPPVQPAEEAEQKAPGTLFGSLWNKAATAWNGGVTAPSESTAPTETSDQTTQSQLKEDPFRRTKRAAAEEEEEEHDESKSSPTDSKAQSPHIQKQQRRSQTQREPELEPVEPITYHRPPEIHPRNVLLASVNSRFRHDDAYDWLGDEPKSPLDAYLFHRQAGRMATKKVRLKRPPPQGMATAPAILSGAALASMTSSRYAHSGLAGAPPAPSGISPGVFVDSTGPVQAFSQGARQPPVLAPSHLPHPGPPPVPPPIPPGYQQPSTSSSVNPATSVIGGTAAAPSSQSQPSSSSQAPNPDALPSFPAPHQSSLMPPLFGGGVSAAPPPQVQPRPPLPPAYPSAPARMPYSYVAPPAAPPSLPAPVFTAPATGPPASIQTEAPLGDMFKTALAKKMFGSQLSDAPPKPTVPNTFGGVPIATGTAGRLPVVQYPLTLPQIVGVPQHPQAQAVPPQSQIQPRLPTPAAPNEPNTSQAPSSSPPSETTTSQAPMDHGVLPPMPIPQSITPPPQPPSIPTSISFAPARPMSGLGGWILPPSTLTPLHSPEPSVSSKPFSPAPSSSIDRANTPTASTTPVPSIAEATPENGHEDIENSEPKKEDSILPSSDSSSPRPLSIPAPSTETTDGESYLSLPSLAALATPLPPSPAPTSIISTTALTPSSTPVPRQPSPSPTLLEIPPSTSSESEDRQSFSSTTKELPPPPPSSSPALPPLPTLSDSSSILDLSARVDFPAPQIPPRPFSSASLQSLPSIPPSLPSVSLERAPSLAVSIDSITSPHVSDHLEVASIVLQPPTPIEPIETQFEAANPIHESTYQSEDSESPSRALSPLTPLSLDLNLDSSPLSFNFDSLDFSTPSIVPDLPDTQSYFSSLGLNFGGGGGDKDSDGRTVGEIERDEEGRLELPVLREENLLDDVEEDNEEEGDDMSDQFDAATSFVSGFHEADLARAKVDPGHTGRTEKWLEGQGMRASPGIESLKKEKEKNVAILNQSESLATIFRPRTAPPSSIPPSSLPPSQSTITRSVRPLPSVSAMTLSAPVLSTLREDDDNSPSPVQTMINFDKPLSALNRGREVSSTFVGGKRAMEKAREEEAEKMRRALGALSNSAFETSLL
ncbi:hypothetical protein JCM3765_007488 [Sporobolomyces pararoseus]